jgi:hypothetical protein
MPARTLAAVPKRSPSADDSNSELRILCLVFQLILVLLLVLRLERPPGHGTHVKRSVSGSRKLPGMTVMMR